MELLDYIIVGLAAAGLVGLAFIGGYERGYGRGVANAATAERQLADRRVRGLLDDLATRKRITKTPKRRARK